jgi:DNA-binding PadR family transcriptional regulator
MMPYTDNELKDLLKEAEAAKFRLFAQGDLAILAYINMLNGKASASQLVLALTLNRGKMVSLTQIAPTLKTLKSWGCIVSKRMKDPPSNRPVTAYELTEKGEQVLKLGFQLISVLSKRVKGKTHK